MATTISSSTSYTLGATDDNLQLTGTANINGSGNILNNTLTGNSGANILKGMAGADALYGGAGNDILYAGDVGSTGDTIQDRLYGGTGDDTLYADGGNDLLYGEAGNDTYVVNQSDAYIIELSGGGVDTVQSNLSVNLGPGYLAGAVNATTEIEKVVLTGSANTNAYGNALANTLTGNAGNNVLQGGGGADTLSGGAGNDTYYLDGADQVMETSGYNGGNDTYIVDGLANVIIDNAGTDIVKSNVSFSNQYLMAPGSTWSVVDPNWSVSSAGIETIELTGSLNTKALGMYSSGPIETLLGNSGDNVLEGAGGNDVLDGRAGNDTLVMYADTAFGSMTPGKKYAVTTGKASWTGGDGQDTFWIGKAYLGDHSSGANQLTITDFTHGVDTLRLGISASSTAPVTLNTITATASDTLATLLNKASLAGSAATPTLTQFAFAGNTYLVLDQNSAATFTASTDLAISLTGTPGLTLSDVVFAAV